MNAQDAALAVRLGSALRVRRRSCGWSQARLAEVAEISVQHVGYLERGERLPSVPMLLKLAEALGTTTAELLGEEDIGEWEVRLLALLRRVGEYDRRLVERVVESFVHGDGDMRGELRELRSYRLPRRR